MRLLFSLYRLGIRLMPSEYRRRYGEEQWLLFERIVSEERPQSGLQRAHWACLLIGRAWWAAVQMHVDRWRTKHVATQPWLAGGRGPMGTDLRFTCRTLRSVPWYSATVVGVVAVALAVATTTFAVVDGVLFRPLPFPDADRLVAITPGFKGLPVPVSSGATAASAADLMYWQSAVPAVPMTGVRAQPFGGFGPGVNDDAAGVALIQENFFDVIGVGPWLGGLSPADFLESQRIRPVILTHDAWRNRYDSDAAVLGREEVVDQAGGWGFRIVGVMPPGFTFPSAVSRVDFLSPLVVPAEQRNLERRAVPEVIARLPPGMTSATLAGALQVGVDAAAAAFPPRGARPEGWSEAGWRRQGPFDGVTVTPLTTSLARQAGGLFVAAAAAVAMLLLITCANVASLMTSRALERRAELGVRRALGAAPASIARLWLLESLVLVGLGTLVGVGAAVPLLEVVVRLLPSDVVLLKPATIDLRVIGFAALTVATVSLLVSIAPIRRSMSTRAVAVSRGASERIKTPGRFLAVSMQVAAALVLTVVGSCLVGSLLTVYSTELPVRTDGVVAINVMLQGPGATMDISNERTVREQRIRDRLAQMPGVAGVASTAAQVLAGGGEMSWFVRPPGASRTVAVDTWPVTEGIFDVLEPRVVAGRLPTNHELQAHEPLLVVTDTVARAYWPQESALGQTLRDQRTNEEFRVVGIVKDVRWFAWDREGPVIYAPYATTSRAPWVTFFLRTDRDSDDVIQEAVEAIVSVDAFTRPSRAAPLSTLFEDSVSLRRFQSWLFGGFAAASLTVVGVGILGLLAMSTARRTREVGIRCALGATPRGIAGLLVREQLVAVVVGLVVGGAVAAWAVRFVEAYLYQISATDPRVWATAVALILVTASVGALIPAWRASRIDPLKALRVE